MVRVKKWHYRFFLEKGFGSTNTEKTITQAILTVLENEKLSWNPYLKIQLRWHQCRYSKTPTSPQKKPLKFLRKKNSVFYSYFFFTLEGKNKAKCLMEKLLPITWWMKKWKNKWFFFLYSPLHFWFPVLAFFTHLEWKISCYDILLKVVPYKKIHRYC